MRSTRGWPSKAVERAPDQTIQALARCRGLFLRRKAGAAFDILPRPDYNEIMSDCDHRGYQNSGYQNSGDIPDFRAEDA